MNHFGPPVLGAIDFQVIIAAIFIFVSVTSWIIRTVQGNNQQLPAPVQRPGRKREAGLNDDIDNFLKNANRNGDQKKPDEPPRPPANRQKQQGNRNQNGGSQRPPNKPAQQPEPASRRIREENTAPRPISSSSGLGSSLTQHVLEHMSERVVKEAQRDVGQSISDSVQKNMGNIGRPLYGSTNPTRVTTAELFSSGNNSSAAATDSCCTIHAESLKKMLRNPESMRQAIIIQEILNRPKCLR